MEDPVFKVRTNMHLKRAEQTQGPAGLGLQATGMEELRLGMQRAYTKLSAPPS